MVLLGSIADDLTGATDLCNALVREGMRTIQVVGVPADDLVISPADAVVVSLKSRTIAAGEAVRMSLASLAWLRKQGVGNIFSSIARRSTLQIVVTSVRWQMRCAGRWARASRSPVRRSRRTTAPFIWGICLSATPCFPIRRCAIIR